MIARYEKEFTDALDLFGCKLDHNPQARYVAAVPMHTESSKIPLTHTLLALVLRKLYDYHMHRGTLDAGIAGVSLSELEAAFTDSTGRELPMKPQLEFLTLLDAMRRWGIARIAKADNGNDIELYVEVLPGIQSLITERSLAMLKAHAEVLYEPGQHSEETNDLAEEVSNDVDA